MRKYLNNDNGFIEQKEWFPHCWVSVECPDKSDYDFLTSDLRIPPSFLESIADADERPRMEHDGGWKLTILRIPLHRDDGDSPYITVPLGIITSNEIIVTVCYHYTELIPDFIAHTHARGISINNEADFILRIMYSAAFWFLRYLRDINRSVSGASKNLEKSIRNRELVDMMRLQKALVYFNTSISGDEMLITSIRRVYGDCYDPDLLEDVDIEIKQAGNTVNVYTDILSGMLDSFASIISNNVNDIMKKMTGVSIVLMIPTLVASFYGMNVAITYGAQPWVFFAIVGGSLFLSFIVFFILRHNRWL